MFSPHDGVRLLLNNGFTICGEIRDIKKAVLVDGTIIILIARNNDTLKIFKWNDIHGNHSEAN